MDPLCNFNSRQMFVQGPFCLFPSDTAIVLTLVKNSQHVWKDPENDQLKTLFKSGGATKRQFGGNAMNDEGFNYYKNWSSAIG